MSVSNIHRQGFSQHESNPQMKQTGAQNATNCSSTTLRLRKSENRNLEYSCDARVQCQYSSRRYDGDRVRNNTVKHQQIGCRQIFTAKIFLTLENLQRNHKGSLMVNYSESSVLMIMQCNYTPQWLVLIQQMVPVL